MTTLYDLVGSSQPAQYDIFDLPGAGPSPTPTPQAQAAMAPASQDWTPLLRQFIQQQMGQQGQAQAGPASRQGFISNSQKGMGLAELAKLGLALGTMGVGTGAIAALGSGSAALGGAGGMQGGMDLLGALSGMGGSGQGRATSRQPSPAPLPSLRGPLVPQSVAQYQVASPRQWG